MSPNSIENWPQFKKENEIFATPPPKTSHPPFFRFGILEIKFEYLGQAHLWAKFLLQQRIWFLLNVAITWREASPYRLSDLKTRWQTPLSSHGKKCENSAFYATLWGPSYLYFVPSLKGVFLFGGRNFLSLTFATDSPQIEEKNKAGIEIDPTKREGKEMVSLLRWRPLVLFFPFD